MHSFCKPADLAFLCPSVNTYGNAPPDHHTAVGTWQCALVCLFSGLLQLPYVMYTAWPPQAARTFVASALGLSGQEGRPVICHFTSATARLLACFRPCATAPQAASSFVASALGLSGQEADRLLARAFGWTSQAYWRREKVGMPASPAACVRGLGLKAYPRPVGAKDNCLLHCSGELMHLSPVDRGVCPI